MKLAIIGLGTVGLGLLIMAAYYSLPGTWEPEEVYWDVSNPLDDLILIYLDGDRAGTAEPRSSDLVVRDNSNSLAPYLFKGYLMEEGGSDWIAYDQNDEVIYGRRGELIWCKQVTQEEATRQSFQLQAIPNVSWGVFDSPLNACPSQ